MVPAQFRVGRHDSDVGAKDHAATSEFPDIKASNCCLQNQIISVVPPQKNVHGLASQAQTVIYDTCVVFICYGRDRMQHLVWKPGTVSKCFLSCSYFQKITSRLGLEYSFDTVTPGNIICTLELQRMLM